MTADDRGEVYITSEGDLVRARRLARVLSVKLGFGITDVTRIVTATSEIARNAFLYATAGVMTGRRIQEDGRTGIELVFSDDGPGIDDLESALVPGFSTSGGLGKGLPGTKRLMDEMTIDTSSERGTTITIRKWLGW